jgi:type III restriction enzyme
MSDQFFKQPILNSPYDYPWQHWELGETRQLTGKVITARRRPTDFVAPIPKPRKRRQTENAVCLSALIISAPVTLSCPVD